MFQILSAVLAAQDGADGAFIGASALIGLAVVSEQKTYVGAKTLTRAYVVLMCCCLHLYVAYGTTC